MCKYLVGSTDDADENVYTDDEDDDDATDDDHDGDNGDDDALKNEGLP